jgi:hypothetical protein
MATDESDSVSEELLNSLVGRTLKEWHLGEDGLYFGLDDGRKIFVVAMAVTIAEEPCLH